MYHATTRGIEVTVEPYYLAEQSDPADSRYVWGYRIVIANNSAATVKLMNRYWHITDENGQIDEVTAPAWWANSPCSALATPMNTIPAARSTRPRA